MVIRSDQPDATVPRYLFTARFEDLFLSLMSFSLFLSRTLLPVYHHADMFAGLDSAAAIVDVGCTQKCQRSNH